MCNVFSLNLSVYDYIICQIEKKMIELSAKGFKKKSISFTPSSGMNLHTYYLLIFVLLLLFDHFLIFFSYFAIFLFLFSDCEKMSFQKERKINKLQSTFNSVHIAVFFLFDGLPKGLRNYFGSLHRYILYNSSQW